MIERAILDEALNIVSEKPLATRKLDEWDEAALAVIFYCPGRDVEKGRKLFLGDKGGHRYSSSIGIPVSLEMRSATFGPNVRLPLRKHEI